MNNSHLLNKQSISFKQNLLRWHKEKNNRSMPWKGIKDVYKIWLSEVILQQTRVEQGLSYYEKFIKTFPTVKDLALASEDEVIKLWEGLGYYARCKNLHFTAKYIAFEREGKFPDTYETLISLKGVGPYTAAAIASFAYNIPKPVIDGNVIRVLSRFFGITDPVDIIKGKKKIEELANECIDPKNPGAYNQAIMDFGATVCRPLSPLCQICPMRKQCFAYNNNLTDQLPVSATKIKIKPRWLIFLLLKCRNKIAVLQRQKGDIWEGLYTFPLIEFSTRQEYVAINKQLHPSSIPGLKRGVTLSAQSKILAGKKEFTQQLTHRKIFARTLTIPLARMSEYKHKVTWIPAEEIHTLPFPRIIRDIIKEEIIIK